MARPTGCLVLVTDPLGRVLLQLRDDIPGICWPAHWALPGGRREPGESWEQAAIREVAEETGILLDRVERVRAVDGDGDGTPLFRGAFDGDESDLVLGEGQELRLVFPSGPLPEPMPPHIRRHIARLSGARAV